MNEQKEFEKFQFIQKELKKLSFQYKENNSRLENIYSLLNSNFYQNESIHLLSKEIENQISITRNIPEELFHFSDCIAHMLTEYMTLEIDLSSMLENQLHKDDF